MGLCFSIHAAKSRRRRHARYTYSRKRRGSRGSANFVIPVTGSSLENATHKYELGKNAQKEIAGHGTGNAFLIEKPISHSNVNGHGNGHARREGHGDALRHTGPGSPNSKGSKHETFFDSDNVFNNESDDEFMSVCGEFPSSAGDSVSYPFKAPDPGRHTVVDLQSKMAKVNEWMAGTSEEVGSLNTPPPEDEHKSSHLFGVRNGIAALAGSTEANLRASDKSLEEGSPRKSFHMTMEERVIPVRPKWERTVSDLLGRKHTSSDASPVRNVAPISPNGGEATKAVDHKGAFDGLCLPRLRTVVSSSKSRPLSPVSFKKKSGTTRLSFKRRTSADLLDDHDLSSKYYLERPLGGSQVPHCSPDKPMDGCWSEVAPSVFKLRGKHYAKDKKKFPASDFSSFVPIGVDLLMSSRKIDHIAQYVELPVQETKSGTSSLPSVFIVNIQLPLYAPAIFMGDTDGEGLSLVLYFKLSEHLAKTAPPHFKEVLRRFVADDTDKVKGFVGDSVIPFRDRLKVVARLVNPEEVQLSAAEKKLLATYNEKPVLSRPQHCFHKGTNYLEVDLDVHRFSYIARKGFDTFRERLKYCVLDIGLTIQAIRPDELPEQLLAGIRLHKLDFGDYRILQAASRAPSVRSDDMNGIPTSP